MLWQLSELERKQTNMAKFMQWLSVEKQLHFVDYETLWSWSIDETALFWEYVAQYFNVHFHTP